MGAESKRLEENKKRESYWQKWGPYVSERQWGTVREDYSEDGNAWDYINFDQSRSRAYRWGEDGIAGICDTHQLLCFAHSFWNEKDPFLKEKNFGLSNSQGNHGEDIKEYFYYLDNTPTHSYMKYLYKYPQKEFPYQNLIQENARRSQKDREYELIDTGIFNEDRYFDIFIEYAKADPKDIYIYITVHNRGPDKAICHVLPTIWFRNTWVWTSDHKKPQMRLETKPSSILCEVDGLDPCALYGELPKEILFTDNETNMKRVFNKENKSKYLKDGFHEYIVKGKKEAVNPNLIGTKAAFHYVLEIDAKSSKRIVLRFTNKTGEANPFADADKVYKARVEEADEFYRERIFPNLKEDHRQIERQALAGMLWSKQFYQYPVETWLKGDPILCESSFNRKNSRNKDWVHLYNEDILSMPDKWEYPWFAAWDLAFHTLPLCRTDCEFAKKQLKVITREWFMHPNGQLPAYEWNFSDVNPPVQAWACFRVYQIDRKETGVEDTRFLESVFQKLLLNFTWWVNREDASGKNIFKGGFLGLDNISVFNRSEDLPAGGELYQSDATSWMGMFALNMLTIAVELSKTNPAYEDMASKFYLHFLYISRAINYEKETLPPLWNEEEGFYYDILILPDGTFKQLKVKSLVGLIPLLAVATAELEDLQRMKGFSKRLHWFMDHRQDLCSKIASLKVPGVNGRYLLSIVNPDKLRKILKVMLDEKEFLSDYGIRSISKSHEEHPFVLDVGGGHYGVGYEPGESTSRLFGGNSNWRGPIWMPINILLIEALQKFHHYLGDDFKIECPTGSGHFMNLWEVSQEISRRLLNIFSEDKEGKRPVFTGKEKFQNDPNFKDYLFFHEYYHGDTGEGLGASHQTGWSGLIAKILHQLGEYKEIKN